MAKRRVSAAQKARLKALRRKYGLGEFKRSSHLVPKIRHSRSSTMAKRRGIFRKSKSSGISPGQMVVGGLVYGALRQPISNFVRGLTGNVALNLSDEVAMGLVAWLVARRSSGIVRQAALAGLAIEASRFGSSLNIGNILRPTSFTSPAVSPQISNYQGY